MFIITLWKLNLLCMPFSQHPTGNVIILIYHVILKSLILINAYFRICQCVYQNNFLIESCIDNQICEYYVSLEVILIKETLLEFSIIPLPLEIPLVLEPYRGIPSM